MAAKTGAKRRPWWEKGNTDHVLSCLFAWKFTAHCKRALQPEQSRMFGYKVENHERDAFAW